MKRLRPLVLIVIALAAWEVAARSGRWSKIVFPSLEAIGREFIGFFGRFDAWEQIWTSLYRAFGGFGVTVERTGDFPAAFKAARESGKPSIIHLKVDPQSLTPTATIDAIREKALAERSS